MSSWSLTILDGERIRYSDEYFGIPAEHLLEVGRLWAQVEELAATVPPEAPWQAPDAHNLDRQTCDSWLTDNTTDTIALRFFRFVVPAVFSAESSEMSLLHFLAYLKSSGNSLQTLLSLGGGAQEQRVVGGTHQISERLASGLGESVQLGAVVRTITQDEAGVAVSYEDAGAATSGVITAQQVVVAIPPTLAGRIRYLPALPAARDGLTQQIPAGAVIKLHVGYPTPFWREDGLSGFVASLDDAFTPVMDNSPPDASCGVLVGFLEGAHARTAAELSATERHKIVIDALVKYFGPQAAKPFDIVEQDWTAEEFTRGCYGGRLGAGVWTQYGRALAAPVGRIHWAGAEVSHVWNGYMEGAILSGRQAADEVLGALSHT